MAPAHGGGDGNDGGDTMVVVMVMVVVVVVMAVGGGGGVSGVCEAVMAHADQSDEDQDADDVAMGDPDRQLRQRVRIHFLAKNMHRRPHCPVVLGCGRGSVVHKVHAEVHAVRLEHRSWKKTAQGLACISRLTDHGVESGMSSIPPFRPQELFPWAAAEDFAFQDELAGEPEVESDNGGFEFVEDGDVDFAAGAGGFDFLADPDGGGGQASTVTFNSSSTKQQ